MGHVSVHYLIKPCRDHPRVKYYALHFAEEELKLSKVKELDQGHTDSRKYVSQTWNL